MKGNITYQFIAKLWKHNSKGGWYFITIPKKSSKEIRSNLQWREEGWGRMKTLAIIKDLHWKTSIWFDTKIDSYVLPIKAEIRKKLLLKAGDSLTIGILV